MNAKILAIVLILTTNFKICQSRNYKNFALIKLVPQNSEDMKFLQNLDTQRYIDILFWKRPYKVNSEVQLLVSPVDYDIFKERASHYKVKFIVQSEDIQQSFDKQKVGAYHALRVDTFNLNEFHTLDNINNWMADMAHHNSKFVHREVIGKTVENRDIYAFSVNKNQAKTKVIVESGIHGHEWMTVAFATYFFNELIHCDSSKNPVAKHLAYNYHWLLVPVANPDGYDYTHKKDRLWRKSRRNLGTAYGVDLNRNFDHSFGKPETKALANFIEYHRSKLKKITPGKLYTKFTKREESNTELARYMIRRVSWTEINIMNVWAFSKIITLK
ncbi:hypothetical protein MSG28_006747 [Choristoneura fumiferana]|uniref:Uncharacterized protein n=1 Tax=Choristoneura fumiferana TaxID=7141 RepID=A0ACC0JKZ5_CHOFU|nr:hypothetical protein MSG28_006747 [Choristoneura fumiferana]